MFQIKLSESTATRRRIPVLLVDSTDGFTPKTGQTAPTVTISKNGATAVSGAGTFTEVGNGVYYYEFTAGEADTLGWIALNVQKAVCRQYNAIIQVMAYDYAAGTNLGLTNLDALITSRMATFTYTAPPTVAQIWQTDVSGFSTVGQAGTYQKNTDALTSSRMATFTYTAPPSVTDIWNTNVSGYTTAGYAGTYQKNLDQLISSRMATFTYTAPPTAATIATQIWTEPIPGSFAVGTAGAKLNSASSAGDPWSTAVPGTYAAGTAGFILGTNLNGTITSRLASASYTAPPTAQNVWEYGNRTLTSTPAPYPPSYTPEVIADTILNRKLDSTGNGTDTLDERTVRSALRAMRNKVVVASGVMTVKKEDDTVTAWTASLSNTANVTVDPT